MAPSPDYSSIIHSPTFTFLVGPEHTKLTIQSALARHVSQPLDELMNSGLTRESRHHIAVLEEEDVETFVGFCEYAYTGDYRVPTRPAEGGHKRGGSYGMDIPPPAPSPPGTPGMEAESLGIEQAQGEEKKGKKNKKKKGASKSIDEGSAALTPPNTPPPEGKDDGDWFDSESPKAADIKSPTRGDESPLLPSLTGGNLWDEFTCIKYPRHTQHPIAGFPAPMTADDPSNLLSPGIVPYVLFHAKIYRFSTRFLIPTLAQLSLNKLHRALVSFPLDSGDAQDNAPVILELLHFTFNNTKRHDPVFAFASPSPYKAQRENQLRKLVVHYAACKIRELASFRPPVPEQSSSPDAEVPVVAVPSVLDLRGLMDITCELASDLVFRMM